MNKKDHIDRLQTRLFVENIKLRCIIGNHKLGFTSDMGALIGTIGLAAQIISTVQVVRSQISKCD